MMTSPLCGKLVDCMVLRLDRMMEKVGKT